MAAPSSPPDSVPPQPMAAPQMGGRNPRTRLLAIILAIVIIVSGIVIFYVVTRPRCGPLASTNPLIFDQAEHPDTLDPAVTFTTPGWAIVQQVYQELVMYKGSSYTDFVPVLAKSWTTSNNNLTYTFNLRHTVHFSNGDAFNAYVMWFSLYRSLLMNLPPQFILGQNFWYPGVNYYSPADQQDNATKNLTTYLNTWKFDALTPSQIAIMEDPNQSFQVIDEFTIALNLGNGYLGTPYSYIFATLAAPIGAAVDPKVIQAHPNADGVAVKNETSDWMSQNALGTGQYKLTAYSGTGSTISPDPNYWGTADAALEVDNNAIQPAKASIQINYQGDQAITVNDLNSGSVIGASFAYLGPSTIKVLQDAGCVRITPLDVVYGSTAGAWWIYMNQTQEPFSDIHVRKAVVHAINYDEIISVAFGGRAKKWVGPVPPGYPYYNPQNLTPYAYDLTLAKQEMNLSKWPLSSGGYPNPINYEYLKLGDWGTVAQLLTQDLAKIGLNINAVGISLETLIAEQKIDPNTAKCTAQEAVNGGPFPIGQEFYTSDYIAPDDWTQNNAVSAGSANQCMSGYNNATMDGLVYAAASESNPANLTADYTTMTQMMYDNYTNAWLVTPLQFQVYNTHLHGAIPNPMGSALPFTMLFNTEYADNTAS